MYLSFYNFAISTEKNPKNHSQKMDLSPDSDNFVMFWDEADKCDVEYSLCIKMAFYLRSKRWYFIAVSFEMRSEKLWIRMYEYNQPLFFLNFLQGSKGEFLFIYIYRLEVQADWNSWARLSSKDRVPLLIHCQNIVLSDSFNFIFKTFILFVDIVGSSGVRFS